MVILLEIIAASITGGDKVLVFSQRRPVLDFIERVLMTKGWWGFVKTAAPPPLGIWGPWAKNKHYYRIDGNTSARHRCVESSRAESSGVAFFLFFDVIH